MVCAGVWYDVEDVRICAGVWYDIEGVWVVVS